MKHSSRLYCLYELPYFIYLDSDVIVITSGWFRFLPCVQVGEAGEGGGLNRSSKAFIEEMR